MDYSYPLLRKIFNHYKQEGKDLSDFHLYSCQHLLAPQYEMYKMFIEFGLKPSNIFALGKAYSSNIEVIKELKDLGINVSQPKFTSISFDIEHANNCRGVIKNISADDKNIILDDGGYLIEALKDKAVRFAVEQTSSGFRKLNGVNLNFPVINVARSKTKLTQESPIIARIIFERVETYVQDNSIDSPKFLVIGLGPIGNSILQILTENNLRSKGLDIEASEEDVVSYLKKEEPDIVIGATGVPILSKASLNTLEGKHIFHFISVSSSDREFPVASFRNGNRVHDDIKYKNLVFVNNGFPITFKGNKYESTPLEIEKTIGLLMGSVLHGIVNEFGDQKGIVDVPKELENLVNS